eukprot:469179-Pleurochrysis_carterae.AAC.4
MNVATDGSASGRMSLLLRRSIGDRGTPSLTSALQNGQCLPPDWLTHLSIHLVWNVCWHASVRTC